MMLEVRDEHGQPLFWRDIDAMLFDMDGVITATADVHARAWKRTFDDELAKLRGGSRDERYRPFDVRSDYLTFVDGRPREEGVRSFFASRHLELTDSDLRALAAAKQQHFDAILSRDGVHVYPDALNLLKRLGRTWMRKALVTSSRNAFAVLERARLEDYFDVIVDGTSLASAHLQGKPAPDMFREAARRLDVTAERAAVLEDAIAGVQAGRRGSFGLVVGVARHGSKESLLNAGADVAVRSLSQLELLDKSSHIKDIFEHPFP